jgi:hypothetical protein
VPAAGTAAAGSGTHSEPVPQDVAGETPAAALARWATQILEAKYTEACMAGAPPTTPGQDSAKVCAGAEQEGRKLHDAWAKPGVVLPPEGKVEAHDVAATGDSVTVPDTSISLDWRSLHELELMGSSGKPGLFSLSIELKKINDTWRVADVHFKF